LPPCHRPRAGPSARSQRGLDWLNFFIADVETAFGPFISVYLAQHGWTQGAIGTVLTVNTAVALATQTPAGALVDWMRRKRLVIAACLVLIAAGSLLIGLFPAYLPVMAGEFMHGVTGGAVRTAVAAIGLGLVGHRAYHTRVGRNQRYDSFGNAVTAAGMGAIGAFVSPGAPFLAAAGLCGGVGFLDRWVRLPAEQPEPETALKPSQADCVAAPLHPSLCGRGPGGGPVAVPV
jgi:MFS family permease